MGAPKGTIVNTHKVVMKDGEPIAVRPVRMNGSMYAYWPYIYKEGVEEMELVCYSNGDPILYQNL